MALESSFKAIEWKSGKLILLDQRKLPDAVEYISYVDAESVAEAIRDMVVRGAPAIGITAAYAVVLSAMQHLSVAQAQNWRAHVQRDMQVLRQARPTAVNLAWAIERIQLRNCWRPLAASITMILLPMRR